MSKDEETAVLRRSLLALLPGFAWGDAALAQDAVKAQPDSYRVALENDQCRVLDFFSRPGMGVCGVGLHSHPAHLTVCLTAAKVRVSTPGNKDVLVSVKAGDVFWSEAETHSTENIGGRDSRALLVELKTRKT